VVPKRVIAHNDRRAVGAVFGVGIASIDILPTSATVYSATSMVSPRKLALLQSTFDDGS
jgi:hypothetical protein